ncbi:DUF742 domain-containing protein [Streptomyces sp. NPDC026673]|uniref:DUF742 domain-containing protein n=1 Tax=Streptomyces sp. NPDC026673 TaxID=3155724 RepID=UPI00340EE0A3
MPADWIEDGSVPLVRPYAMVRGRTGVRQNLFELVTFVVALVESLHGQIHAEPEHLILLGLCQHPLSVGELAARTNLPLGVVRVLLGDLLEMGAVQVSESARTGDRPSIGLIREVLKGLRAL